MGAGQYVLNDVGLFPTYTVDSEGNQWPDDSLSDTSVAVAGLPFIGVGGNFVRIATYHMGEILGHGSTLLKCVYTQNDDEPHYINSRFMQPITISLESIYLKASELALLYHEKKFVKNNHENNRKNFSGKKSEHDHIDAYRKYLDDNIQKFLKGDIKKPWASANEEEKTLRESMGEGFYRTSFRKARENILCRYPDYNKTNLSQSDLENLRAYIEKETSA